MATRGNLGGLARATADLAKLMDAAGKDYVLIETVGVGQAEIEIANLAQVTVVVLMPGMGDDVQAIKAGILEIADIFAINKSDQPGADRVEQELEAMLSLSNGRKPAIVKTEATTGAGVDELLDAIRSAPCRAVTVRERSIPLHVTALKDAIAHLQSAGASIQPSADGHLLVAPPAGVLLELIEEKKQPAAES
jgi:LAO/AO transport system kinase